MSVRYTLSDTVNQAQQNLVTPESIFLQTATHFIIQHQNTSGKETIWTAEQMRVGKQYLNTYFTIIISMLKMSRGGQWGGLSKYKKKKE
jgi:hypothetical protein